MGEVARGGLTPRALRRAVAELLQDAGEAAREGRVEGGWSTVCLPSRRLRPHRPVGDVRHE